MKKILNQKNKSPFLILFFRKSTTEKTFYSRKLARQLSVPHLALDDIKETLYDLGFKNETDQDKKIINDASFEAILSISNEYLKASKTIILDIHTKEPLQTVRQLAEKYNNIFYSIELITNETSRSERYNLRIATSERHKKHYDELKTQTQSGLNYERSIHPNIVIDTTEDSEKVYRNILREVIKFYENN